MFVVDAAGIIIADGWKWKGASNNMTDYDYRYCYANDNNGDGDAAGDDCCLLQITIIIFLMMIDEVTVWLLVYHGWQTPSTEHEFTKIRKSH